MNNNAKNKFNGRKGRFGNDGPRRSAPEPDLCILRADGSNLSSWLENMHRHMQKEYGDIGQYIETTRNMHIRTLPIKPDLKKEISVKFVEDAHWNYYVFRNINSQLL